jgi:cytochrome b561
MLKSTPNHYGQVAVAIHWLSAIAVILMLITGLMLDSSEDPATTLTLVRFHVPLGITIAILTLLRIVWWIFFDRHPAPIGGMSKAQENASRLVHLTLYVAILIMVGSGIGMVVLTGAMPQIIAGTALPNFSLAPPSQVHGLVGRLLIVLALGHIGAALYHQFVRRDNLIARMRPQG